MNDARVRDYHDENNRKVYSWAGGADNLKKPGARHPGEDYNCRCYAKAVRDPALLQQSKSGRTGQKPDSRTKDDMNQDTQETLGKFERRRRKNKIEFGIIIDREGNVIAQVKGNKHSVSFNVSDLKKASGGIVSHNHPNGSSFSIEDVLILLKYKLAELRAIGKEYRYSIKATRGLSREEVANLIVDYNEKKTIADIAMDTYNITTLDQMRRLWIYETNKIWVELAEKYAMIYTREEW